MFSNTLSFLFSRNVNDQVYTYTKQQITLIHYFISQHTLQPLITNYFIKNDDDDDTAIA